MANVCGSFLKTLFIRDAWNIGYRFSDQELLPFRQDLRFQIIKSNIRWWYADPFCIEHNGKYYIFCEMFDGFSGVGSIGVAEITENGRCKVRQVIKEPFHMSYPNVFSYKGTVYMIPETKGIKQIRLYKAVNFPYEWVLDKILIDDVTVVDSTILTVDSKKYIFTYEITDDKKKMLIYEFDIENKELIKTDSVLPDDSDNRRPAGNFVPAGPDFIRPAQYNANFYGEKILLYKLNRRLDSSFSETLIGEIPTSQIAAYDERKYRGIHTINKYGSMETVDLLYSSICIAKPFLLLVRLIRKIL
jgi:hypothetical protein